MRCRPELGPFQPSAQYSHELIDNYSLSSELSFTDTITFRIQTCHPVVGTGISGGGGFITNGIAGGGVPEIRERGVGDFIFEKLTVIFKNLSNFCPFNHVSHTP